MIPNINAKSEHKVVPISSRCMMRSNKIFRFTLKLILADTIKHDPQSIRHSGIEPILFELFPANV